MSKKLVLVVVDALHPEMFARAVDGGSAPTFRALVERGRLVDDCVSSFPSVTPVACSDMMTGCGPRDHWMVGMNWYQRVERRYVEYGSSLEATRTFGLFRTLYDLVYNMNLAHLSHSARTLFERLGGAGVRTACTPFLIYRGKHRHNLSLEGMARRMAEAAKLRHAVWGPDEFFYGDLYASRKLDCIPTFSRPGTRDPYSACVGESLVRDRLFDFLLFNLPDNDHHSHRFGPEAQPDSIARADLAFAKLVEAGGGIDRFLDHHAVILVADHSQTDVVEPLPLAEELGAEWLVLRPNSDDPEGAELAVSPTSRAAGVYVLADGPGFARTHAAVRERLGALAGVELVAWLADFDGVPVNRTGTGIPTAGEIEAVVEDARGGRLRFRPGGRLRDARGNSWRVRGDASVLEAEVGAVRVDSPSYPDGLARLWSALCSPHAGDLLLSAAPGFECVDWGGATHVGGGSHGGLGREDSLAPLLFVGCGPSKPGRRPMWALRDIPSVVLDHFGLQPDRPEVVT